MSAGAIAGSAALAAYAIFVFLVNGRTRPGRPSYAVSAARFRAIGWLMLAGAVVAAGNTQPLFGGLLGFAALGVMIMGVVVGIRGKRASSAQK